MYIIELNEIIENGENNQVEFKRKFSTPEKIAKEMIAFANTKGGLILFGVDDDRKIIGVESEKGELELINQAAKLFCKPEIKYTYEIISILRKDVLIVQIDESKTKPHFLIDNHDEKKAYIRIKDKSVLASKETVNILKRSNPDSPPMILNIGHLEKLLIDYLSKNDRVTVKTFKHIANISNRRASRILINLAKAEIIRLNPEYSGEKEDYFTLS